MRKRKFNGFNDKGYLPKGIYHMTLDEFRKIFSNSKKREEIMNEYEKHLEELKNTKCFLDHWIDGSFITSKENPND